MYPRPVDTEVRFSSDPGIVDSLKYEGFFDGWVPRPDSQTVPRLVKNSSHFVVAHDGGHRCIGYITGLTDAVLFSYISSLEVLPEFKGQGIGRALVEKLLELMPPVYAVDLVCDTDVQPFYEKCGFTPWTGALIRRRQAIP